MREKGPHVLVNCKLLIDLQSLNLCLHYILLVMVMELRDINCGILLPTKSHRKICLQTQGIIVWPRGTQAIVYDV